MTSAQLKTWWRIKKRVMAGYAAELFVFIELPLCLLINWALFLSIPLWIWLFFMANYVGKACLSQKNVERKVLTGKVWFWEQFKQY